MNWLIRNLFSLLDSRFIKSISRYLISGIIGAILYAVGVLPEWLQGIPAVVDAFTRLADFLTIHQETLAEIIATFLGGVLLAWSALKNKANAHAEKLTGVKVK